MYRQYCAILLSAFFSVAYVAQNADSASSRSLSNKIRIGILPSVYFTPETNLSLGALVYSRFKLKTDSITKLSLSQTYLNYTLNHQYEFENDFQVWFPKNHYFINASFDYLKFPQFYFGIGNNTSIMDQTDIDFKLFRGRAKILRQIKGPVYLGFQGHCEKLFDLNPEFARLANDERLIGNMGFKVIGGGPLLIIDKRNNQLNPSNGLYFETFFSAYQYIRSKANYTQFVFDFRKYYLIKQKLIWNANLFLQSMSGDVPFKLLSEIGGPRFLRGYYRGRFRDKNMIVLQHEFRMPIYKRIGVAIFNGIGKVAPNLQSLVSERWHYNYGLGLRYLINKKDNANIRIDYGLTRDSRGLYIIYAEAF